MAKAADKLAAVTSVPERKDINFKLTDVTFIDEQDQQLNWDLSDAMTSFTIALTTTGASTVKPAFEDADYAFLDDPVFAKWAFGITDVSQSSARNFSTHRITAATDNVRAGVTADMEWVLGQRPIDLFLDTIAFRLCGVKTQQTILTTTFEDRVASLLRDKRGFKTATRGQITRAGFIAELCKEAGVPYFIPEVDVKQPIAAAPPTTSQLVSGRSTGAPGLTSFQGLTVKGSTISSYQAKVAAQLLQVAQQKGANLIAQIALIWDAIFESDLGQDMASNGAYGGVLGGSVSIFSPDASSIVAEASAALDGGQGYTGMIGLSKQSSDPMWVGSQSTRAVPFDSNGYSTQYESQNVPGGLRGVLTEAQNIVQAFSGNQTGSLTKTVSGPYQFTRGRNEDSWDCIQRLASEVGWYAFVRENRLWYVSGNYLFAQEPQLEVRKQTSVDRESEGDNGIDWVDVDLDVGARDQIAEVEVMGRTHLWTALPGMIVQVNKRGPANGKWMVSDVALDLLDDSNGCTITLQKPLPARPEPSAPQVTKSSSTNISFGNAPSGTVQAAYQASLALSNMALPYLWGGGHQPGGLLGVHAGGPGLDCSGSVCWVLHQAGMFPADTAIVSGDFGTWGAPGQGSQMTIWYSGGHVWIEFNLPGLHMQMNTVSPGDVGPRLYAYGPPGGDPAGFLPRQWPSGSGVGGGLTGLGHLLGG